MKANYHTHTTFSDGRNTPEEMIQAAIDAGFSRIGISDHADMIDDFDGYVAELVRLKKLYAGRIEVLAGLESEGALGLEHRDRLDYVIGSFHYVNGFCYDDEPKIFTEEQVRAYFAFEREFVARGGFDFLAHPDLVLKFNEKLPSIATNAEWYHQELVSTADAIAASGLAVEINTGAISRGWRTEVYPSEDFRKLLQARGVRFLLSSDAHSSEALIAQCGSEICALVHENMV